MARIRTIKPEFWTSGQVLECSTNARLLFIGLWNFADDEGRHAWRPKQIKAQIFPSDPFTEDDILGMLLELSKNNLITPYTIDNEQYFYINGWRHQRIDKPQKAKYPEPIKDDSGNILGTFPPERIGKERIVEEGKGITQAKACGDSASRIPECPHQEIIDLFHATLPLCPRIKSWTGTRQAHLRQRWRENPFIEDWKVFFEKVAKSKFLTGKVSSQDRKPFVATLDWLIKPENFAKVMEGRYE